MGSFAFKRGFLGCLAAFLAVVMLGFCVSVIPNGHYAFGDAGYEAAQVDDLTGGSSASDEPTTKSIAQATATLAQNRFVYDGKAKNPTLTVRDGAQTLIAGKDYAVTGYSLNGAALASGQYPTMPGSYRLVISGIGAYAGTTYAALTIDPLSIGKAKVSLAKTSYGFDGAAKKPAVTVTLNGKVLRNGTDYRISYLGNVNAGTASVQVSGMGIYGDSLTKTFTIKKASLTKGTARLAKSGYTYDGNRKTPGATVKVSKRVLKANTDYKIRYTKNINAGTAKATIVGIGNYQGSIAKTFTIKKASLSKASIKLSATSYVYNGKAKKPSVSAKMAGRVMKKGADFAVKYSDNVNAGKAKVTLTGKRNYKGTATKKFTIQKASISKAAAKLKTTSFSYSGAANCPKATVRLGGRTLVEGKDYGIRYAQNKSVGTAKATIVGKGNYKGSLTKRFKVKAASLGSAAISLSSTSYYYDGDPIRPGVTVQLNGRTLVKGRDYKVRYEDNDDYGTGKVYVQGIGNYRGTKRATFSIQEYVAPSTYVMNVNSGVFHHDWCSSVSRMKESNKAYTTNRADAIGRGCRPCSNCNP